MKKLMFCMLQIFTGILGFKLYAYWPFQVTYYDQYIILGLSFLSFIDGAYTLSTIIKNQGK